MKYIKIDPEKLKVESIVPKRPYKSLGIPMRKTYREPPSYIEEIIYYDINYCAKPAKIFYRYPKRKYGKCKIKSAPHAIDIQPWMVTIAYLMWHGILQGLAWDSAKLILKQAMDKLRRIGAAPKDLPTLNIIRSETKFGFSLRYSEKNKKSYEIFVGLKKNSNKMSLK